MHIAFATAEINPLVSAGGLGEAAAGLVAALRQAGHRVTVILPDYLAWDLDETVLLDIDVPDWAAPAAAVHGHHPTTGEIVLIDGPGIRRPDPYVDADGEGWTDNDHRFASFSAAAAAVIDHLEPDVVQLNDWHTSLVPAFAGSTRPTVLTIHNLAHQGWADADWLHRLPFGRDAYRRYDGMNMLAGAIALVDRVVTVSSGYAAEIVTSAAGMGLDDLLAARGSDLVGIRNGIDTRAWNPETDPHLAAAYGVDEPGGKDKARALLADRIGWKADKTPTVAMVTRLVDQKGVDLAFEAARFLDGMRARLVVLGSGERRLAEWGHRLAKLRPDRVWFHEGFDVPLSHQIFAGADLLLMPSRFEPCGLAQMQAMAYGTIPVVTDVGGLRDTVIDADASRDGNGFIARNVEVVDVVDALHRGLSGWRHAGRRRGLMSRGMAADWSWDEPGRRFSSIYAEVLTARVAARG